MLFLGGKIVLEYLNFKFTFFCKLNTVKLGYNQPYGPRQYVCYDRDDIVTMKQQKLWSRR